MSGLTSAVVLLGVALGLLVLSPGAVGPILEHEGTSSRVVGAPRS